MYEYGVCWGSNKWSLKPFKQAKECGVSPRKMATTVSHSGIGNLGPMNECSHGLTDLQSLESGQVIGGPQRRIVSSPLSNWDFLGPWAWHGAPSSRIFTLYCVRRRQSLQPPGRKTKSPERTGIKGSWSVLKNVPNCILFNFIVILGKIHRFDPLCPRKRIPSPSMCSSIVQVDKICRSKSLKSDHWKLLLKIVNISMI